MKRLSMMGLIGLGGIIACGSSVELSGSTSNNEGSGGLAPDASVPDPQGSSSGDPGPVDAGSIDPNPGGTCTGSADIPYTPPLGDNCACGPVGGFELAADCGSMLLAAPGMDPNSMVYCQTENAWVASFECKEHRTHWLSACRDKGKSPCIELIVKQDFDQFQYSGRFIDGDGIEWTLSDIQLESDPLLHYQKGLFSAAGLNPDGKAMTLKGSFNLCYVGGPVCPI